MKATSLFQRHRASSCMLLKQDFPWWENADPPNPLKSHSFREGRAVLLGRSEERAPVFHLHGESESPHEVFTASPALPPQWSAEITARGLAESAERRCGEILIESSTRPQGWHVSLCCHLVCRKDSFHLCSPRGGAAVDCTEDTTEQKDGHAR